jgi:hypothetical protein
VRECRFLGKHETEDKANGDQESDHDTNTDYDSEPLLHVILFCTESFGEVRSGRSKNFTFKTQSYVRLVFAVHRLNHPSLQQSQSVLR